MGGFGFFFFSGDSGPDPDPVALDIRGDAYELLSLIHEMNRASTLRFTRPADLGDADGLANRTMVVYVADTDAPSAGTSEVWFVGWTIPAERSLGPGDGGEAVAYVAADYFEVLARTPCAEENLFYNRTAVDVSVFPYPESQTVQDIVEAEFASIVGGANFIGALDFSDAGDAAAVVPPNFSTEGKTFLGLLEALTNEVPNLGYWLDPSTCTAAANYYGATLRFYDLAQLPSPAVTATVPHPTDPTPGANVESVGVTEDISGSYDTVELRGWGDMEERYEELSPEWDDPGASAFGVILRDKPSDPGTVERYSVGATSGAWHDDDFYSPQPWHPESRSPGYQFVYRRYSTSDEVVDLKLVREGTGSPARYVKEPQSMLAESLHYVWHVGPIGFFDALQAYQSGSLRAGVKYVPWSNGLVDDLGDVAPHEMYGDPPAAPFLPRLPIAAPAAFERNFVLMAEPLVMRTGYYFTANASGLPGFDSILETPCYAYWPTGEHVWLRYTARSELEVSATNPSLGLDRTLRLYDQRLFKYTDINGVVFQDDTAKMQAYVDSVLAMVGRARVYGSVSIDYAYSASAKVQDTWPMGCALELENWNGTTKALGSRVQSRELTQVRGEHRLVLGFDRALTFAPLERAVKAREFFEGNRADGAGGLQGRRGNELVIGGGREHRPAPAQVSPVGAPPEATQSDEPSGFGGTVKGVITARTAASGLPSTIAYSAALEDGSVSGTGLTPWYRPYTDEPDVLAAQVGSKCLVWIVPKTDNSGYTLELCFADEKLDFEACSGADNAFETGDGRFDVNGIVVDPSGNVVVDPSGNVVVGGDYLLEGSPENAIVTSGPGGSVVFNGEYNAVVSPAGGDVDDQYFDSLLVASADYRVTTSAGLHALSPSSAVLPSLVPATQTDADI